MARKSTPATTPPPTRRTRRKLGFVIQKIGVGGVWSDLVDQSAPLFDSTAKPDAEAVAAPGEPLKFDDTRAARAYLETSQIEGEFRICQVTDIVVVKLETIKRAVLSTV